MSSNKKQDMLDSEDDFDPTSSIEEKNIQCLKLEDDGVTEIKYIYHLSDIHINNTKRHTEYNEVFTRLYDKLRKKIGDNQSSSLIVLTGDIMHGKTEISPESMIIAYYFFKNLSDIATVICIVGNHDCNLSNLDRLDPLSPIVHDIGRLKNFYYLKKSGFYQYYNIMFGYTSIFDQKLVSADQIGKVQWSKVKQHNRYRIALYHGPVQGSVTDVGYRMRGDLIVDHFKGYDYVLLGDNHRHQYLNNEKTIAYAGSLIQQDYGEKLKGHGFIRWNLEDQESRFYEIQNDYGYIKLKVIDGKLLKENDDEIPIKPRIWFILENTNQLQCQEILEKLNKRYTIIDTRYDTNFTGISHIELRPNQEADMGSMDKVKTQNTMIREYLHKHNFEDVKSIIKIHRSITKIIEAQSEESEEKIEGSECYYRRWTPLELRFSNVLSYGENNLIDFRYYQKNKIIGISGPNYSGKSNILDIILFCLFDKISRAERRDVMNKNANTMYCSLLFSIADGQKYLIERIGRRNRNGRTIKIDVNFFSITGKNNKIVQEKLNGLDKNKTNQKIIDLLGTYEDCISTSFCLQIQQNIKSAGCFLDLTPLHKKEYLSEILKLNVFEKYFIYAKDYTKELIGQLKLLEQKVGSRNIQDFKDKIAKVKIKINVLENQKNKLIEHVLSNCEFIIENIRIPILRQYTDLSGYQIETINDVELTIDKLTKQLDGFNPDEIDLNYSKQKLLKLKGKHQTKIKEIEHFKEQNKIQQLRMLLEKQLKECKPIRKEYDELNLDQEIKSLEKQKEHFLNKLNSKHKNETDYSQEIELIKQSIKNLRLKIIPISNLNLSNLKDNIIKLKKRLEKKQLELIDCTAKMNQDQLKELSIRKKCYDEQYQFIRQTLESLDKLDLENREIDKLKKRHLSWIKYYEQWSFVIQKILDHNSNSIQDKDAHHLIKEIKEIRYNICNLQLDSIEYYKNISINNSINQKIISLESNMDKLIELNKEYTSQDLIKDKIKTIDQKIKDIQQYNADIKINKLIENEINETKNTINFLEKKLASLEEERDLFHKEICQIEKENDHNQKLTEKIRHLKLLKVYHALVLAREYSMMRQEYWIKKHIDIKNLIQNLETDIEKKKAELIIYKKDLKEYMALREEFDQKSSLLNLYQVYTQMMSYNGLPYNVIVSYLPKIESEINKILHSITNFSIEIKYFDDTTDVDNQNNQFKSNRGCVDVNICYTKSKSHTAQLASGFQRFIINLAIRMILSKISLIPKPSVLIIDEGLSSFDKENLSNVPKLMDYIKMQYDHVIVISHLEELKNCYDYIINVNRVNENEFSHVYAANRKEIHKTKNEVIKEVIV
jgi:DNA repair exonuclease SbcCD ATPase subunit